MLTWSTWISGCLLLASAVVLAQAGAKWLGSDDLERECRALSDSVSHSPNDRNGTLCVAYLQGFIAGSTAADVQRPDSASTDSGDETFSERAIRTRAESYVRRYEDRLRRTYCVGDDVPVHAVVDAITAYLESQPDDPGITAHDTVYEALVRHFPCAPP